MDIKHYIHSGRLVQNFTRTTILEFTSDPPDMIILLLEGKCRRKLSLKPRRVLYENYYPLSFIGLEDYLLGFSREGGVGAYAGAHYCLWDIQDFQNALRIYPELAHRIIFELSRRVRIYDAHQHKTDISLRAEASKLDLSDTKSEVSQALYDMSFADEDEFPASVIEKLSKQYQNGDYLMRQGESSTELFIIYSGEVEILQKTEDGASPKTIDKLGPGSMVGEMAQFDGLLRSADVKAVKETQALVFRPRDFSLIFQLHPRWSQQICSTLAERIEQRRRSLAEARLYG